MGRWWRYGLGVVAGLLLILGGVPAEAATFAVNSTADAVDANPGDGVCATASGLCTLRAAIMEANALGGDDAITLGPGTYTLTIAGAGENAGATGDLDITGALTIHGAGAASTIIDGGGLDRVIDVRPGATVQINGVTIRNGNVGGAELGGSGGGIVAFAATLTLTASIVSGNVAAVAGGGIAIEAATARLIGTTVSGNTAAGGGGVLNRGSMLVRNSTIAGNQATLGDGGGLWNDGAAVDLINSTVSGNFASGSGGGVFVDGSATFTSTTVTGNGAASGGGIFNAGNAVVNSTIVAGSPGGNCGGNATVAELSSHNLSSDATCAFGSPGDLNGVNPALGPLAGNGGATATHALLSGSPAIDAVPAPSCLVSADQRGVSRPQGAACDIGAFEAAPVPACVAPPAGLVAWWPMDEAAGAASLQDIVGGNDAAPIASPVGAAQGPQPVPGMVGGAMLFQKFGNGSSGARVSPQGALAAVGAGDLTIDVWVRVPAVPPGRVHHVVNRFDASGNRGYAWYAVGAGSIGSARLEFTWADGTDSGTVQTAAVLTAGQWHHVAVTFARGFGGSSPDVRLYVDGVQRGQSTAGLPGFGSLVNAAILEIGRQPSALDEPIGIDELEIFNVALPASAVRAIASAGSAGKCQCLTGGQSVDVTVAVSETVLGAGVGAGATVNNPLTLDYSVHGCAGHEMFLIVNASFLPVPVYFDGSGWVPVPSLPSLITPFVTGGPQTADGAHTLFSGSLPAGTYDVFLVCDLYVNGRLNVTFPPLCLGGAFDHLPLTVQ